MSANVVNQVSFLRTTRNFPTDIEQLGVQVNKAYLDIANAVNERTIGLFPTSRPAVTGEAWFIMTNSRQQTRRQIFRFGAIPANGVAVTQNHGIPDLVEFSKIYGTCITTLPDFRPIPYASVAPNANIDVRVTSTQIIIVNGVGGVAITQALIVLEWLSPP